MQSFEHASPELRLFCGGQSLSRLPQELARAGSRRAFVVCGASVAGGAALPLLVDSLGASYAGHFAGAKAHSPLPTVEQAARAMREAGADAVIALGGGSAIVTARAANILLAEGGDLRALCTSRGADGKLSSPRLNAAKLPQFVVPSTPTTALAKAGSAVLDPATGHRLALFDPKTRARAVFVHPAVLASAPASLVRGASLNALAMAVEGLESAARTPMADADLVHALRLLSAGLPLLGTPGCNDDTLAQLVVAALLCGRGTDQAGGGLASVLGHAIGPRSSVANGIVNAIVLPHTLRFNAPATVGRVDAVSAALGVADRGAGERDAAAQAVAAIEALLARLPIPRRLRDAGVAREDFEAIADEARQDWFLSRNPRPVEGRAELLALLEAAW